MPAKNKGFSLVEVLVGMTIGLLGMVVITQVFSLTEASKQTTTSGGDAQQNAALSLHTLERDIRMAGYGINSIPALAGCKINAYNSDRTPQTFNFIMTGIVIDQGTANLPDTITVTYSSSSLINAPASLTQNMPTPAAVYKVNNRFGFNEGDLIIAAEAGKECTLGQTTGVPGAGNSDNVIHNSGNYTDPDGSNKPATFNKPGGVSNIPYTTQAKLYNIGPLPISNMYSIVNNALVVTSNFTGVAETVANNVMDLQAEYGIDTNNDNAVDAYQTSADLDGNGIVSGTEWSRILSVRYGLVTRSVKKEPGCNVTTTVPKWTGGDFNNITSNADWECYRYRVFETTTLMRNTIWKP